jgi:hypothetical protein
MTFVLRRRVLLTLAACACGLAGGCLSPTLPLPPPNPPDVQATDTEGVYRLTGTVTANSHATAWNQNTDLSYGQQTQANGRYDFVIAGTEGDTVLFYYTLGTDQSQPIDFELKVTP